MSPRTATSINRKRAAVNPDEMTKYFDELKQTLEGVPASNILNVDETNLADNPGKEKKLFPKGENFYVTVPTYLGTYLSTVGKRTW